MSVSTEKSTLRLALFFILLIFILGCFLAYISLRTISRQKDMTVNRILESERQWARSLSEQFETAVLQNAQDRMSQIDTCFHQTDSWKVCVAQLPFENVFVLDAKGQIQWPATPHETRPSGSNEFLTVLQRAERAEFAESDAQRALEIYEQLFRTARNNFEKAKALNAMARICVKENDSPRAIDFYRRLFNEYAGIVDDSGIAFADYAGHQLLKIATTTRDEVLKDLIALLYQYKNGAIPFTPSTSLLLAEIETRNMQTQSADISSLLKCTKSRLHFLTQHSEKLSAFANNSTRLIERSDYHILPLSHVNDSLIFVAKPLENPYLFAGCAISIQPSIAHLDQHVSSENPFTLISQVLRGSPQKKDNALSITQPLSSLAPHFFISVSPEQPNVIEQFITRNRIISFALILLFISGMIFGFVLVLRDVGREKQLTQIKMDFISSVTHELKTPLTSIRLLAETIRLQRVKDHKSKQDYLNTIGHEAERLSRLINNVLDFSRIEKGSRQYTFEPANLSQLVHTALATVEFTLKENDFRLTKNIESNVTAIVDADALEQALLNLLSNSIKYSQERKDISVEVWQDEQYVHLQIKDRGVGIAPSEHEKIFEKFYRSENTSSGAGLGLTVVRHIVDAHGGRIELDSDINRGSTFTLVIPLERNSHESEKYSRGRG